MKRLVDRSAHMMTVLALMWIVGGAVLMATPGFFAGGNVAMAAKNPCNPCNPCAAKANPCNPCAAKASNPCNPCAAKANPCNPCAAKANNPCNPCNPCAKKK